MEMKQDLVEFQRINDKNKDGIKSDWLHDAAGLLRF